MTNTQGVIEACYNLLMSIDGTSNQSDLYFYGEPAIDFVKDLCKANRVHHKELREKLKQLGSETMPAGVLYCLQLGVCINDYLKRPGIVESMAHRPKVFKPLATKDIQRLSGLDSVAFAQHLFDVCTDKGTKLTPADDEGQPSPIMLERCLYAAFVYTQVTEYLERQSAVFVPVPFSKGMFALAWINTGIIDVDENTNQGKITVGDVVFSVSSRKISTGALMLNDFLLWEANRTNNASIRISLREYAIMKKRSTTKQALQKLRAEVYEQMQELASLKITCQEIVNGKKMTFGEMRICGGFFAVTKGVIAWDFNQSLFEQIRQYAPTDYPVELWAADPRTSTYYFGKYITQNWRLNEGKKGREKIYIRTLVEKSPNLPTYEEVKKGNRDFTGRIVKRTFSDLDALETLYYEFYTESGDRIENPDTVDYKTFINGYILVDYSEHPAHPDRIAKGKERAKKAKDAKEKAQLAAAAKAAVQKGQ